MSDDDRPTDTRPAIGLAPDSLSDTANIFVGAVLVGIATYRASTTLAIHASGRFPDGGTLGALFTLFVFAVGVVFLVDGAASVFAEKRSVE